MRQIRWLRALGCAGFVALCIAVDACVMYGCYSLAAWMLGAL